MAIDQNFKNKAVASEIDTVLGRRLVDWQILPWNSFFLAIWHLLLTYKYTRKPLLGNLFVADRIFFGRLRPEDIQYCHSWKLKLLKVETVETSPSFFDCIIFFDIIFCLAVYCFTNIVSSVRVSVGKKPRDCNLKVSSF